MADKIFLIAKRIMKQAMSKMYCAPLPHDMAEMGDRNYVRGSSDMNKCRKLAHKTMKITMRHSQGYAWPKKMMCRGEMFAPRKLLSA